MLESIAVSQPTANPVEPHPKGGRAWVLLTSVFGPYARDDEFAAVRSTRWSFTTIR